MIPPRLIAVCLLISSISPVRAVETVLYSSPTFNTNNNIASSVSGWSSGWGTGNTNTGWNYIGQVSDASGVYLGNGWVLTAAHVNSPTTFTINGNTYDATGLSYTDFTNSNTGTTNADINLFQISTVSTLGTPISLPPLTLASAVPSFGDTLVMIGYGYTNGQGPETWGNNTISHTSVITPVNSFASLDFTTADIGSSYGAIVLGDSGGGDFVKVGLGTNAIWELEGINEATGTYIGEDSSFYVQLSSYYSQIDPIITAVPEPRTCWLLGLGVLAILGSLLRGNRILTFQKQQSF